MKKYLLRRPHGNMRVKNIIRFENQKEIYWIKAEDGDFTDSVSKIKKYALSLKCRKNKCSRRLTLHLIKKLRWAHADNFKNIYIQ